MPTLDDLVMKIKQRVDPNLVGMIACHNGVVRGLSRNGQPVEYLEIQKNPSAWEEILDNIRERPGIAAVEAHLNVGHLKVGDDIFLIAIAGDIRENVFPALEDAVNQLKSKAILKREKLKTA